MADIRDRYDALVIGGGIAGMQAALDLGEQGFEVLLVERTPSIGGVMVGLNKVFPTLDCSSCICTPRMAESAHHPRIRLQTYTEVRSVEPSLTTRTSARGSSAHTPSTTFSMEASSLKAGTMIKTLLSVFIRDRKSVV